MIISGGPRANWRFFGKHLVRTDENERVTVAEIRGLAGTTPMEALREMDALAGGTSTENFFYHVNINPREDEHLTPEQWEQAVDTLEKNLGLEGQSRIVVEHEKEGRTHRHVIWSRIDPDTMTAISDSHNYARHAATSRELETEFNLQPVRGILMEPDGPRPDRRPKNWETFRGHKSGVDPNEVKREVTQLWQESSSGQEFRTGLAQHGYVLAQGDKRGFIVIDRAGDDHSLARRIEGVKVAEIRSRLADIDVDSLPRVQSGRSERRRDQKSVAAAVGAGADSKRIDAAINAARASEISLHERTDGLPDRDGREAYDQAVTLRQRTARPLSWQEVEDRRSHSEKELER